jgi:hypothetical protein
MSRRDVTVALTETEADLLHALVGAVLVMPHVWREADGWDHQTLVGAHDALVAALEGVTP